MSRNYSSVCNGFVRSPLITVNQLELTTVREEPTDPSIGREGTDVSLQDLLNSPEFLEEQRSILLEFETARLRVEDRHETSPRRSRRSSIGIKLTCPVCLESLSSVRCTEPKMVTECGHVFCRSCIEDVCEVSKGKALCPVCRENVGQLRKVFI